MLSIKNAAGTTQTFAHDHPSFSKNTGQRMELYPQTLAVKLVAVLWSAVTVRLQDTRQVSVDGVKWWSVDPLTIQIDEELELPDAVGRNVTVHFDIGPFAEGTQTTGADNFGLVTCPAIHQAGPSIGKLGLVYEGPLTYYPLLTSLAGVSGGQVTFLRATTRIYGGVSYAPNIPIFDVGLALDTDERASITIPAGTHTILVKLLPEATGLPTTGTGTILSASGLKLTIAWATSTVTLTDGVHSASATFTPADVTSGLLILAQIGATAYVATSKVGGTKVQGSVSGFTTTISADLTAYLGHDNGVNPLAACLAHISCWSYDLQALAWVAAPSAAPVTVGKVQVPQVIPGTWTLETNRRLFDSTGKDWSYLVSGDQQDVGTTDVTVTMTAGLAARWHAFARDTEV
jgi:hypothetical protein